MRGGGAGLLRGGGGGAPCYNPHRSLCITMGGTGYNTSLDQVLAWVPEDPRAARRGGKAQYARVQATEGEGEGKEEGEGAAAAGGASKSVYALPAPEEEGEAYRAPSYLALLRPESPRAGLSSSADIHLNVRNNSYDRMYLCAHSVEVGA